jgi:hypothetical protein
MTLRITITEEKNRVIMALAGKVDSFSRDELLEGFDHVKGTGKSEILFPKATWCRRAKPPMC